jgi:putative tryptophan/tyrosine transport system substrate-binding protein
MRRRSLIVGGLGLTWLSAAFAQHSSKSARIAVLMPYPEGDAEGRARLNAFTDALSEFRWADGKNLQVDTEWAGGSADRIRTATKEIVASHPDLILAVTTPVATACASETTTVPILFVSVTDPVGIGIVANLASSGRNVTGFTNFEFSVGGKWLQIVRGIAPHVKRVAVLFSPRTAPYAPAFMEVVEIAARELSLNPQPLGLGDAGELKEAFQALAQRRDTALLVLPDVFTTTNRESITRLANENGLPAIYPFRFFALAGGLVSYGFDQIDPYRRAAQYADRILRGESPATLPIQHPTTFEMVINLKTARQLGIEVSPTILAQANEVIE